jgi:hypothetical protein
MPDPKTPAPLEWKIKPVPAPTKMQSLRWWLAAAGFLAWILFLGWMAYR